MQGAAIMALGTTMPTHRVTFKDGVVEQNNFYDMAMPRMPDAPKVMTVSIVPSNDPPKGMGEPGLPPLAPARGLPMSATLEPPLGEAGVLVPDATAAPDALEARLLGWWRQPSAAGG